jgi:hypothetical protein
MLTIFYRIMVTMEGEDAYGKKERAGNERVG